MLERREHLSRSTLRAGKIEARPLSKWSCVLHRGPLPYKCSSELGALQHALRPPTYGIPNRHRWCLPSLLTPSRLRFDRVGGVRWPTVLPRTNRAYVSPSAHCGRPIESIAAVSRETRPNSAANHNTNTATGFTERREATHFRSNAAAGTADPRRMHTIRSVQTRNGSPRQTRTLLCPVASTWFRPGDHTPETRLRSKSMDPRA